MLEKGVTHTKRRLHKVGYFAELMTGNEEIDQSIRPLLKLSREHILRAQKLDYALVGSLERDPLLAERLKRLRTVPGVDPDHRADVGTGDRQRCSLPVDQAGHQLLRAVRSGKQFSFGSQIRCRRWYRSTNRIRSDSSSASQASEMMCSWGCRIETVPSALPWEMIANRIYSVGRQSAENRIWGYFRVGGDSPGTKQAEMLVRAYLPGT